MNFFKEIFCSKKQKNKTSLDELLDLLFWNVTERVSFMQVGANDGEMCDPLRKHILNKKLYGIMIEPQAKFAEKVEKLYENDDQIKVENLAISGEEGELPFYYVSPNLTSQYIDLQGVASFDESHVKKEIISNLKKLNLNNQSLDEFIVECTVKTNTYESIIKKHGIDQLGLLAIDAEGFDYQAIKLFPFKDLLPSVIIFEHKHLSSLEKTDIETMLRDYNYSIVYSRNDAICINKS